MYGPQRYQPAAVANGPSTFVSARSLVGTKLTPIGTATIEQKRPLSYSTSAKTYDRDGWATGKTTIAGYAPSASSQSQSFTRFPSSVTSSSSFMDAYRLSKNHLAHEGMTMNSLLGHPPARADVKSFQSKNAESLKGFMDMLPASTTPTYAPSSKSQQQSTSTSSNQHLPSQPAVPSSSNKDSSVRKKQLGTGRRRPA
jgi:hypothetical protein